MGRGTMASGTYSTASGYETSASGVASTASGYQTTASGYAAMSSGQYTTASGYFSMAMGLETTASGYYSTAMGSYSTASGNNSTATGNYTTAQAYDSFVIGTYNVGLNTSGGTASATTWVATDPLFEVGNGGNGWSGNPAATSPSDALVVYKNGNARLQGALTTTTVITTAPAGDIPMYTGN